MSLCQWILRGDRWHCEICGVPYDRAGSTFDHPPIRACSQASHEEPMRRSRRGPSRGVGDFLHEDLLRLGFGISADCRCAAWIRKMNAWGPSGCLEHLTEIIAHLLDEAGKRHWEMESHPRFSRAIHWAGYFGLAAPRAWAARWVLKRIVLGAIEQAEDAPVSFAAAVAREHIGDDPPGGEHQEPAENRQDAEDGALASNEQAADADNRRDGPRQPD